MKIIFRFVEAVNIVVNYDRSDLPDPIICMLEKVLKQLLTI
jgi:hypothetical protein